MDDRQIGELRQRYQRAQQGTTQAQVLVDQARGNLDKAEERLRELGLDPDRSIDEQVDVIAADVEHALADIEVQINEARRILNE